MSAQASQTASGPVPLIGFGHVRHTRLRPVRNAFCYPTYFLMLPTRSIARGATTQPLAMNRRGALSFFDVDHGDGRTPANGGALAWLDELLRREGIDDASGEVWLHCYPRVLGYAFKPVSFWFCHSDDNALRAIVVEVHNTFGERHCYLLDAPGAGALRGTELLARKLFHVSPFCRVEGQYRLRFMRASPRPATADALKQQPTTDRMLVRIDYEDAGGTLLQTSVSGALEPLTKAAVRTALWRYPAMTFGVIARIHLQAAKLWLKRVQFVRKPALPESSVTR